MATPIVFDEILFDPAMIRGEQDGVLQGWPEFANTVIKNQKTGVHKTNVNRFDPLEVLIFNAALLTAAERAYFLKLWRGGYGSGVGFRVRVPYDFTASGEAVGTITMSQTKTFRLCKTYRRPGVTAREDVRYIVKPVLDTPANLTNLGGAGGSVRLYEPDGITARVIPSTAAQALSVPAFTVKVNNATTGFTWTLNNTTGLLSVTTTSASGTVQWWGELDVPVAFMGNTLPFKHDVNSEAQNITLREILPAELGIVVP